MAEADQQPLPIHLHGDLDLMIIEARRLPNMDVVSDHLRRCVTACGVIKCSGGPKSADPNDSDADSAVAGHPLRHRRKIITSDPYVTVSVPQATVARTRVLKNAQNPVWNEHFIVPLAHPVVDLEFRVKDNDVFGADLIGTVKFGAAEVGSGKEISGWFPIEGSSTKPDTALHIRMKFTPCEKNPIYRNGIAGDPEERGVRNTYFPVRKGSSVKLYQDAHCKPDMLPAINLDNGLVFGPHMCWEDICYSISEAHHMIYITGWSIFHKVKLVREPTRPLPRGGDLTLGELLKYKSQEGVRVLLLVWDDKTSHDSYFINTAGVMQTHDEETRKFFKHSSVICVLAPRYASSKLSYMKQKVVGTLFTHHQKCVLVDTQAFGNNRKITAFLGGLDLCDGRYDTPEHRLYRDVNTVFQGDFHQPTLPSGHKAPRQPWHDLHCRIEGPAAYDVLINFEQRWKRATKWTERFHFKSVSRWNDDALLKVERISWILSPHLPRPESSSRSASSPRVKESVTIVPQDDPELWVAKDDETWHVQILRSIDSGSVKGFPKNVDVAKSLNLTSAKDLVVDNSIQTGYIQAIRSAQHFIYIENQYFLGSSYAWPGYKDAGADNLIPMELALKIASKIRANERFAVYVIIPMWPEGNPKDGAMQEILFWQAQTMQMMYDVVAQELKSMKITHSTPQDYLNFYCLGNRERFEEQENGDSLAPVTSSHKFKRFMIYVHAKGMIVDDEYVIVGSANINQRSMAGTKDTEIAMGSYQPYHSWARRNKHPHGQVYGYRMSLWAEHLGGLHSLFEEPESVNCVRKVNEIAKDNWKRYASEEFSLLQGHILKYPIHIDDSGKIGPLLGHENFPDVGGKVLGAHSNKLPDMLTT